MKMNENNDEYKIFVIILTLLLIFLLFFKINNGFDLVNVDNSVYNFLIYLTIFDLFFLAIMTKK